MKKLFILLFVFSLQLFASLSSAQDKAQDIYDHAGSLEERTEYKAAEQTYLDAHSAFMDLGETDQAYRSLLDARQMHRITLQYPYTEEEAVKMLNESYPYVSEEISSWIAAGKADFLQAGGAKLYFEDLVKNIAFRDIPLIRKASAIKEQGDPFFDGARNIIFRLPEPGDTSAFGLHFTHPIEFMAESSLIIPREKLPQEGLLKLWVPMPIETSAQSDVRVVSISPEKYLKIPLKKDADIGIAYFEIDLNGLKEDVNISTQTVFTRYEEHLVIDPSDISEYDTGSPLYKRYTRSQKNIPVDETFRKKALEITGKEKDPYLAAKKIYDHILDNVRYSFMPHVTLAALDVPEPVFVMKNSFGDCGAQSMYFSSLCRALGIPARACGGMQLFPGAEGDHFWAEFYLPNYGWIPVDTTIAESSDWTDRITDEERRIYKDFYFGNLDPYRLVIQNDVDAPLYPAPEEKLIISCAIQEPAVVCVTCADDLAENMDKYWKIKVSPVEKEL
ncbi:MAG: transglutaminase-like domain-containing protein [Candidatus Omnitrophota bacterium]